MNEKIKSIIASVLRLPGIAVTDEATLKQLGAGAWDAEDIGKYLEEEFDITLSGDNLIVMRTMTVAELVGTIERMVTV